MILYACWVNRLRNCGGRIENDQRKKKDRSNWSIHWGNDNFNFVLTMVFQWRWEKKVEGRGHGGGWVWQIRNASGMMLFFALPLLFFFPPSFPSCLSLSSLSFISIKDYYYYFCVCVFFAISWAASAAYGGSQARGLIGAVAAGPCQSHKNVGSELHLQPTPKLTAMPDP